MAKQSVSEGILAVFRDLNGSTEVCEAVAVFCKNQAKALEDQGFLSNEAYNAAVAISRGVAVAVISRKMTQTSGEAKA